MLRETPARRHSDYPFLPGKVYLPRETHPLRSALPTVLIVLGIAIGTIYIFIKAWPS